MLMATKWKIRIIVSKHITVIKLLIIPAIWYWKIMRTMYLTTMAVVVEWLACLPVTQKIGVHFYLERESSTTSGRIDVGREWCCRGWSIEGGTPGGLFRTREGTKNKEDAGRSQRESVCDWNKNIVSAPKRQPCMNACMCTVFHCICVCMCSN